MNLKTSIRNTVPGIWLSDFRRYRIPRLFHSNAWFANQRFRHGSGRNLDLSNPTTLNEKICWLIVNGFEPFHTILADKFAAREYWSREFGPDGLVPLPFWTDNWRDIRLENLPDKPCIVKSNTGSGWCQIIRDKHTVNFHDLRLKCKRWMHRNYYYMAAQPQYKGIRNKILVEELLLNANGRIPNDCKLHFINGKLAFVFSHIDPDGANGRLFHDADWNRLDFDWYDPNLLGTIKPCKDVPPPKSFPRMVEIGTKIAKRFSYVRVDFYDVEGKLYYGEITLHTGGGKYAFSPPEWDLYWGRQLVLPNISNQRTQQ